MKTATQVYGLVVSFEPWETHEGKLAAKFFQVVGVQNGLYGPVGHEREG